MKKILLILFIAGGSIVLAGQNDDFDLYKEAKKKSVEQKWQEAIDLFDQLIEQYPQSRYIDDAEFWKGYCLEKMPGRQLDAFNAYEKLINEFNSSSWIDDALIHQLTLAEQFIVNGQTQYKTFLFNLLESDIPEIRHRAAISLGKLNEDKALPFLKKMRDHEDFGKIAGSLISSLKSNEKITTDTSRPDSSMKFKIYYDMDIDQKEIEKKEKEFLWFDSKRYSQYKSMLKKKNDWNKEELHTFGMWHILDTDVFQEFYSLSNEYDKKEWLRKYWELKDPTPTTEENEIREEFERRVIYAKSHFSDYDRSKHFKYLRDQHITYEWEHAPWDARGELYIKYGEPDARSVAGWRREEWTYFKYGVDFYVKQYMTNIYGNAVSAGPMAQRMHSESNMWPYNYGRMSQSFTDDMSYNVWNTYVDQNFVYNNEFRYEHDYQAEAIDDFDLEILQESNTLYIINYYIPLDEFKIVEDEKNEKVDYFRRYRLINEDMREVAMEEAEITFDINQGDEIKGSIVLDLNPGNYLFSIRIEDLNSSKLGIYRQELSVK